MTAHVVFFLLVVFALLGDARIFLFIINRVVFGSHRHEKNPWKPLLYIVPPILLFLTALFWPVHQWITWLTEQPTTTLAKVGALWLVIAASVGMYWIIDRARLNANPERVRGVRRNPSDIIRLRKAHMPIAVLRRLGAHNDVYDIEVTHNDVFIDDLDSAFEGYRIAFLTDTHVAGFVRRTFYREIVAQVSRFDPDLILLGGDFVTWRRHIPLMADVLLTDLTARDGVLAVLGNHDYWAHGEEVKGAMSARGVEFIINRSHLIRRDGVELPVIGIDEIYRGEPDVVAAFAGVKPGPRIGVTHHPDAIDILDGQRIDLLLCGHTHGGQIRFPFFGAVVVPSMHESRYADGFHRVGGVLMYVSRGIGAIPPVRILCRPEVATFTLRKGTRSTSL
ncbi:MAG TPA: metallophosphoesterase [Thermoanaerobaculia bacterium]|nr:metallophosphoesterase [Thermoanaerobaculia bacterium]